MVTKQRGLFAAAILALVVSRPAGPEACGPGPASPLFVNPLRPYDEAAFARGNLDVIQPTYVRWHLVEAYRTLTRGFTESPLRDDEPIFDRKETALDAWVKAREAVLKSGLPIETMRFETTRRTASFYWTPNCLDGTFRTAVSTLRARVREFGASSREIVDWIHAQDRVFENCAYRASVFLPEPAPAGAPATVRADRAYQTAAAYFYAEDYVRAGQLFEAIAQDATSPWRRWGRYLVARTLLRRATNSDAEKEPREALLARAESSFRTIAKDPAAGDLRGAAAGLADFAAIRHRPLERLHELSAVLMTQPRVPWMTVRDYTFLMDKLAGSGRDDAVTLAAVLERDPKVAGDDLTNWIVTFQTRNEEAGVRARDRWRATKGVHWLIAALWNLPPAHADVPALLSAAAEITPSSPAFRTVSFLRVRALTHRGRRDDARGVLASIRLDDPALPPTAANLFRGQAFMLATSFDDLLTHAARAAAVNYEYGYEFAAPLPPTKMLFDVDAAEVLTWRMPLARLLEASSSPRLPDRARAQVARAAWTRAVVLKRDAEARALVPTLRTLWPDLAGDLDAYEAATTADARHKAAILLLLRSPGMRAEVLSSEEREWSTDGPRRVRVMMRGLGSNWWCSFGDPQAYDAARFSDSRLREILGVATPPDFPAFVTPAERAATERELAELARAGPAPNYLAAEALAWAQAQPRDPRVAEALARTVDATRWGCADAGTGGFSKRAFQTLHRLFPRSTWAQRTKYWYGGR